MKTARNTRSAVRPQVLPEEGRTPQAERTSESRRRLIDAGIVVLNDCGFAGTTTPVVALQAGVSRGRMTHHFPSKNDLLVAVVEELGERFLNGFRVGPVQGLSLSERVQRVVTQAWSAYGGDTYQALIQLHLGATGDAALRSALDAMANTVAPMELAAWQQAFEGTAIAPKQIERAYQLLRDQMRGMALQRFFGRSRDQQERLATLQAVFQALVEGALPLPAGQP